MEMQTQLHSGASLHFTIKLSYCEEKSVLDREPENQVSSQELPLNICI